MTARWRLYVRDAALERIAEIDDFTSLEFSAVFNRAGRWLLTLPAGSRAASLLDFGGGIVVVRDGTTVLAGPLDTMERTSSASGDVLVAAGPDDNAWLERRLALPVPLGPPYTAQAYDVRTGAAETVMRAYVEANAGPSARSDRRVAGLSLAADQGRGFTVTGRGRFHPLGELLRGLAIAGGDLGWQVAFADGALTFEVYDPADLTATAIFSSTLGNLAGFRYSVVAAEANYVVAGGGGEGTARTVREGGDSASIVRFGRIESFRDQRHTSDTAEIDQAISEELSERAEKTALSIEPIDTAGLTFGRDYDLGDRVTVMVDGVAIRDVVREVRFNLGTEGERITPFVGTPGSSDALRLYDDIRRLRSRIGNLERA